MEEFKFEIDLHTGIRILLKYWSIIVFLRCSAVFQAGV